MSEVDTNSEQSAKIGRRSFIAGTLAAVPAAAALGQSRDYGRDGPPVRYPDRDIVVLDPRFARYRINNTPIQRLYTGMLAGRPGEGFDGIHVFTPGASASAR